MFLTPDLKDIFYVLFGLAFLLLTMFPLLKRFVFVSTSMLFLLAGAGLYLTGLPLPEFDLTTATLGTKLLEHFSEIIVIVALAGAGLAIDRDIGWKNWRHAWQLLLVVMPLTVLAVTLLSYYGMGFTLASSVLLAAVLAPTDPVLARAVQVDGPHSEEEDDVRLTLTAEAGLNDGLAFPFIYLALALFTLQQQPDTAVVPALLEWLSYDLLYRVAAGLLAGIGCGVALTRLIHSSVGDASSEKNNAGLVLLACTFLAYGIAELVDGYGFIAVFAAAAASKHLEKRQHGSTYSRLPHHFSDQIEKIMVAVLLVWTGYYFLASGAADITLRECGFALALLLVIRPALAMAGLWLCKGSMAEKGAMAFLGIRGIGSFYYLAYAVATQPFSEAGSLWRIVLLTVILSVFLHGVCSRPIMRWLEQRS